MAAIWKNRLEVMVIRHYSEALRYPEPFTEPIQGSAPLAPTRLISLDTIKNWKQVMPNKMTPRSILLALGALCCAGVLQAQLLDSTVNKENKINQDAAASQKRVTSLAQQTSDLLAEYRAVVRETDALKIYNDQLEKVVTDQRDEVVSINRQLEGLEDTNRGVVPLMLEMVETLGQIVESDMPFRLEERRARVERLRSMMDQADVTTSEKYRRVMEAYQGEIEYGRTTESYSETLPTTGQTVDFLRVGRTLLVYQTPDQESTGWFNPTTREYEELPGRYRLEVKEGISIAKNEKAPNLVVLPVPGPEVSR
jgi:regulator of replication initiation timing